MNRVGVHALVWVGGWSEAECHEVVARGEHLLHDALAVTRDLGAEYLGGVLLPDIRNRRLPKAVPIV
jgi:hypothetical protein